MIISVVAVKIWYLKNVRFLLGHPVYVCHIKIGYDTRKLRVLHARETVHCNDDHVYERRTCVADISR